MEKFGRNIDICSGRGSGADVCHQVYIPQKDTQMGNGGNGK